MGCGKWQGSMPKSFGRLAGAWKMLNPGSEPWLSPLFHEGAQNFFELITPLFRLLQILIDG
jgi:hypothetical protein